MKSPAVPDQVENRRLFCSGPVNILAVTTTEDSHEAAAPLLSANELAAYVTADNKHPFMLRC